MRPIVLAGLAVALAACILSPARAQKGEVVELFNGKDLKGWRIFLNPKDKGKTKPEEVFSVKEGGVLDVTGRPSGYVITEADHEDYLLEVQWRFPGKPGNSGVFVHVSGPDKIWPRGVEAQLFSGRAGDFWLVDGFRLEIDKARQDPKVPRHYFRMKTDREVEKAVGEWNQYRITCRGDTIRLEINGQFVNEGTKAEASRGKILLQSEGAPIQFRNIRLTKFGPR